MQGIHETKVILRAFAGARDQGTRRDHVQCGMHRGRVGPRGKKKWVAQRSHGGKKRAPVAMPEAVGKRYTWKCILLVCTVNGATDGATIWNNMWGNRWDNRWDNIWDNWSHDNKRGTRGEQEGNKRGTKRGTLVENTHGGGAGDSDPRNCVVLRNSSNCNSDRALAVPSEDVACLESG